MSHQDGNTLKQSSLKVKKRYIVPASEIERKKKVPCFNAGLDKIHRWLSRKLHHDPDKNKRVANPSPVSSFKKNDSKKMGGSTLELKIVENFKQIISSNSTLSDHKSSKRSLVKMFSKEKELVSTLPRKSLSPSELGPSSSIRPKSSTSLDEDNQSLASFSPKIIERDIDNSLIMDNTDNKNKSLPSGVVFHLDHSNSSNGLVSYSKETISVNNLQSESLLSSERPKVTFAQLFGDSEVFDESSYHKNESMASSLTSSSNNSYNSENSENYELSIINQTDQKNNPIADDSSKVLSEPEFLRRLSYQSLKYLEDVVFDLKTYF